MFSTQGKTSADVYKGDMTPTFYRALLHLKRTGMEANFQIRPIENDYKNSCFSAISISGHRKNKQRLQT